MSNPRILLPPHANEHYKRLTRCSDEFIRPTEGSGPCKTRKATQEEKAVYDLMPKPVKSKKKKYIPFETMIPKSYY